VSAAVTSQGSELTPAQVAELRRWAGRIAANGADAELRAGAVAAIQLADEAERLRADAEGWSWSDADAAAPEVPTPERCGQLISELARRDDADAPAVARAIRRLAADVALLRGEPLELDAAAVAAPAGAPPRRSRIAPLALAGALLPALCLIVLAVAATASSPSLDASGPTEGALLGRSELASLELSVAGEPDALADVHWTLDGRDVTESVDLEGDRAVLRPRGLSDGPHEVEASRGGLLLWTGASSSWSFTSDGTPPQLRLPADVVEGQARTPFVFEGEAVGATALLAGDRTVPIRQGRFELRYPGPPSKPIELVARDAAGNEAARTVSVVLVPRLPASPVRAVHVTADAWANDDLRAGVLRLVDDKRINAVELDLKDESGVVGWDAPVPLGREIGAVRPIFDLAAAVKLLHDKGARVIGRLVAFRDPVLAEAAWKGGERRQVIQTAEGKAYSGGYGGFTNFADPTVRRYNIDIAAAAAAVGVDDILYDYVRRPDGPVDSMRFPGLSGTAEDSIVSFLAETRRALAGTGAFLGASVFGIAVTRPDEIAQDVPAMAREVDYIAPMIYPSHWGPGEYGVASPDNQPYDIVLASLQDYDAALAGTGARLVPWLQDFSLGAEYGPDEVRAQIRAGRAAGVREFLLWDPAVTYTEGGLETNARFPTVGEKPSRSGRPAFVMPPNEAGVVPVLMFHQVLPDGGGDYDLTPAEYEHELERLYSEGYRPVRASDLVNGTLDVPRGTTPIVLTFDDATSNQAALLEDGSIDPDTAVGILLRFARTHPGFEATGTFYVNREPFAAAGRTGELLEKLAGLGFEFGNHTHDHLNLSELSAEEVQQQIVLGNRVIHEYLPDAKIETVALPLGVQPLDPGLALAGSWDGEQYAFKGVMLVGAEPAPSPYTSALAEGEIPRIRSTPDRSVENGSADWLDRLRANPELRYVSDGDPARITVPADRKADVAESYVSKVRVR
jgi:hypothetical protein